MLTPDLKTSLVQTSYGVIIFFITGTARIDLIAKVMDLDNDIGGYNFDIPLLEKTQKAITEVGKATGTNQ